MKLLTAVEVRDALRLDDVCQVYELCRTRAANRLPGIRIGKYLRFVEADLLAWLEAQRNRNGGGR
jgi:hypothetical protein